MIINVLRHILAALILSLVMLAVSLVIWLFKKNDGTPLQDILFIVGAVPVALFSIHVFGRYFGRGDHAYQLSIFAIDRSSNQKAQQDVTGLKSSYKSGMNWVAAGLVILLICYLM